MRRLMQSGNTGICTNETNINRPTDNYDRWGIAKCGSCCIATVLDQLMADPALDKWNSTVAADGAGLAAK